MEGVGIELPCRENQKTDPEVIEKLCLMIAVNKYLQRRLELQLCSFYFLFFLAEMFHSHEILDELMERHLAQRAAG